MSTSLQEITNKIKSFLLDDRFYFSLLIVMVGIVSFGLGRMSVLSESTTAGVSVFTTAATTSQTAALASSTANYVASQNGSRYYPLDCTAADRIYTENKIYFMSKEQALAAGYTATKQCD